LPAQDLSANDNWEQLYNAVINIAAVSEAVGIENVNEVSNALGFNDLPDLVDPFPWLLEQPFSEIGQPWLCLAPVNSPTTPVIRRNPRDSPRHANKLTGPLCTEPVQLHWDVYNVAAVTGSNAH
jgi:hypothetical protein